MDFNISLKAGVPYRQGTRGRMLMVLDTGVAAYVALRLDMPGQNDENISQARKGFKARLSVGWFEAVEFVSPVDTTARFIISENDIDLDFTDGSVVKAEIQGLPLPVSNDRGTPGNLLHVTAVTAADAPATAISNGAPVACGPAAVVVAAANASRRALRFLNLGPDPVALGAAGITWASRCIVLEAGDVFIEDRAANLAWSGITGAGKAASVTVQGVTA